MLSASIPCHSDRKALLMALVNELSPRRTVISKIAVSTFTATTTHALLYLLSRVTPRTPIRLLRDEEGTFSIDYAAKQMAETAETLYPQEALADPRWVRGAPGFISGSDSAQARFRFGSDLVQIWFRFGPVVGQVWFKFGSDLVQIWVRFGSYFVHIWLSFGSYVVRMWYGLGIAWARARPWIMGRGPSTRSSPWRTTRVGTRMAKPSSGGL